MESLQVMNEESLLPDQKKKDQSSRFKRKLTLLLVLIVVFSIVFAILIASFLSLFAVLESTSLPANPTRAIRNVCYSISGYRYVIYNNQDVIYLDVDGTISESSSDVSFCIRSLSNLHVNTKSKTNPSKIFAFSLTAAINYLKKPTSSKFNIQQYEQEQAVLNCRNSFNNSLTHLSNSLTKIGIDPDAYILRNKEIVGDIKTWMSAAESEIEACLDGFKVGDEVSDINGVKLKAKMAKRYVKNCLGILENLDNIFNMFYPPFGNVLGSFIMTVDDAFFSLGLFFCAQFLFIAALFVVFFRLHRR